MRAMKNISMIAVFFGAAVFLLSACSLHAPGKITENRIRVEKKTFIQELDTDFVTADFLSNLATHYNKHGRGPINLMMGYDPQSRQNNAMAVSDTASEIARILRGRGVGYVEPSVIPIKDLGEKSRTIISYTYYDALVPKDCDVLVGYRKDMQIEADDEYKLGCTIETVFAKQIARPKDLAGHVDENDMSDGRRSSNIVDVYRAGVRNESLGGESASGSN